MFYSDVQEGPYSGGRVGKENGRVSFTVTHKQQEIMSLDCPVGGKVRVDRDHGSIPRTSKRTLYGEKMMPLNPYSFRNLHNCLDNGF